MSNGGTLYSSTKAMMMWVWIGCDIEASIKYKTGSVNHALLTQQEVVPLYSGFEWDIDYWSLIQDNGPCSCSLDWPVQWEELRSSLKMTVILPSPNCFRTRVSHWTAYDQYYITSIKHKIPTKHQSSISESWSSSRIQARSEECGEWTIGKRDRQQTKFIKRMNGISGGSNLLWQKPVCPCLPYWATFKADRREAVIRQLALIGETKVLSIKLWAKHMNDLLSRYDYHRRWSSD